MPDNLTEEVRHSPGGNPILVEMAPYAVVVRSENTGALCTGTLVTLNLVLTLARCFYQGHQLKESYSTVEILAGVDTLANTYIDGRTQSQRGVKVTIHPNFRPTSKEKSFGYNDLALIETETPFNQTPTVRAMTVGFLDSSKIHTIKCMVSSYGTVNPFTPSHDDDLLKMSRITVTRRCLCHDRLGKTFGSRTQRWFCGRPDKSDPTPCVGAGGAGLVCDGKVVGLLVGLVSFHDLPHCEYSRKTTAVSCDNIKTIPIFLDLCPFMPWFRFLYEELPLGPVNCSKASYHYSSIHVLLVVMIILGKGKLQEVLK